MVLLVADDPGRSHDLESGGDEQGPGVADAVGLEPLDLLDDAEAQGAERDLGVDEEHPLELLGRERVAAPLLEAPREGGDVLAGELQAGRGGVAAEGEQAVRSSP